LGISSAGRVITGSTMITPVYLSLNKGDAQSIPWNVETTVVGWTNIVNNTPSAWNNATGTFTCPRAGIYDISFAMMIEGIVPETLDKEFATIINFNSNTAIYVANFWMQSIAINKMPTVTTRVVLSLNVGDIIRPSIYQNLRNDTAVNTITGRNHFIINELPNSIAR
jgi:hypothetical protein